VRVELVTASFELLLEFRVVLDNAIVDNRDVARTVEMGVGVDRLGSAVGGPAGVSDARGKARGRQFALFSKGLDRLGPDGRTSAMPAES
jgi:hypothetical protein